MSEQAHDTLSPEARAEYNRLAKGPVRRQDAARLVAAIQEFEEALPGWWWSICACQISRDASCGPTLGEGPDAHLCDTDEFGNGFHCDDREGDCADALRDVMRQALEAKRRYAEVTS